MAEQGRVWQSKGVSGRAMGVSGRAMGVFGKWLRLQIDLLAYATCSVRTDTIRM